MLGCRVMAKADYIAQVFNSTLVSGPETLVLPNLREFPQKVRVVLIQETRKPVEAGTVAAYARDLGFPVDEIPITGRMDLRAVLALAQTWRVSPPALVHAHGPKASLYSLAALKWARLKAPLVTTHHGVRGNDTLRTLKLYEAIYEKIVIPRCSRCLTVCSTDLELLRRRGMPAHKLRVHLNGTDRDAATVHQHQAARRRIRESWGLTLDDSEFLLGVVGRLSKEKRHERALAAVAQLRAQGRKVRLLCFGSGGREQELRAMAKRMGVDQWVNWMGYRPKASDELVGLDGLLSCSSAEGLPINLIEAGWAALPVVATGVDGVKDLIEHGKSGILVDDAFADTALVEALEDLLDRPDAGKSMGWALQERVRAQFSRSAWNQDLERIYGELAAR